MARRSIRSLIMAAAPGCGDRFHTSLSDLARVQKRVNAAGDTAGVKERRVRQAGPPPLPFALTVGVTGHRLEAIPAAMRADVERRLADALARIEAESLEL